MTNEEFGSKISYVSTYMDMTMGVLILWEKADVTKREAEGSGKRERYGSIKQKHDR